MPRPRPQQESAPEEPVVDAQMQELQDAISYAVALHAVYQGKIMNLDQASDLAGIADREAQEQFEKTQAAANEVYQQALIDARDVLDKAKGENGTLVRLAETAVLEARSALENHQHKIKERHDASLDLLNVTTTSGGSVRI